MKKEVAQFWGFRGFKKHRRIVKRCAKFAHVSESEIIRRAIEAYGQNAVLV